MLWLLLSCGEDTDTKAASPCAEEDRAVDAVLDATFSGEALSVTVTDMDPPFPAVDDNTWGLRLEEGGAALPGCALSGTIDMPDHGHSGPVPEITERGEGAYELTARLTMGGYWEIVLDIACPETADTVTLNICAEG